MLLRHILFYTVESVTIIDTLVRAGAIVTVANANTDKSSLEVVCSRGVKIMCNTFIEDCESSNWVIVSRCRVLHLFDVIFYFICQDLVAIPGGMPGATNLRDSTSVTNILKKQHAKGSAIGAICMLFHSMMHYCLSLTLLSSTIRCRSCCCTRASWASCR
jgi:4-methyl-5(b-hydroxyethyl)-thiazole monophosphate biosynthesis